MAGKFSIEAIFKGTDNISKVMARIQRNASGIGRGLQKDFAGLGKNFSKITEGIGQIASVAGVAGVALGGLAAVGINNVMKATNEVADGQARLASVMTTTAGFSVGASARMKEAALDWSKTHRTTAAEFEKGAYMMVSAGLNEVQALAATRTASLMATATFGDAGQAAAALATVYNTLGDKTKPATEEIGRLGDIVTRVQQTFQFKDLEQLTEGLKYAVPTAKMYGMSLEEVSTVIGMLNNAGLQGTQAGTAFAASMQKMIPASKELGFALAKTKGGALDFGGTLVNIHKKFGDFDKASDATKLALESAFGRRGIAAIALLSDQAGKFASNLGLVNDNADAAAKASAIIEAAGSGPLDILMNKLTAVKVRFGDALSPVLSPMVEGIGKIVDSVGDWIHANEGLISGGIQRALATAMPIVQAFGASFMEALPAIKDAIGMLFTGFGSGAHWIEVAKEGASILGKIAAGAIGVAAVFGGALAAGFELAVGLCNDVVGGWNSMVNGIGRVIFAVDDFFANLGAKWRAFSFAALADYLIEGLVNGIKSGAYKVADAVKNLGSAALDALKSIWDSHSPAVKFSIEGGNAADGVVLGIRKGIPEAVRASQTMAEQVLGAMALSAPAVTASASVPALTRWTMASMAPQVNAMALGNDSFAARVPQRSEDAQPEVLSPRDRGAADDARLEQMLRRLLQSGDGAVITVRAEKGSSAEVTEQPKSGYGLKLQPSGGL